jgi:large subunit ribosomal protein L9
MKVILRQDVKDLGQRGALVNVADGFARNYLLPRGLAVPATDGNLKQRQQKLTSQKSKADRLYDSAESLARRLDGLSITVHAPTGDGGRLFGSVTAQDVAKGISVVAGADVDRRKIDLPENIKSVGTYEVVLRLHPKVSTKVEVRVEPA